MFCRRYKLIKSYIHIGSRNLCTSMHITVFRPDWSTTVVASIFRIFTLRKRLNLDHLSGDVFRSFWHSSSTTSLVCVCVFVCACVCLCTCFQESRGSKGSEAPAGLFSTELSPQRQQSHYTQQPSTDWLHSAAVLEIEFFLSPTGTNHITFTLFILLFCHTLARMLTHWHIDSHSFT